MDWNPLDENYAFSKEPSNTNPSSGCECHISTSAWYLTDEDSDEDGPLASDVDDSLDATGQENGDIGYNHQGPEDHKESLSTLPSKAFQLISTVSVPSPLPALILAESALFARERGPNIPTKYWDNKTDRPTSSVSYRELMMDDFAIFGCQCHRRPDATTTFGLASPDAPLSSSEFSGTMLDHPYSGQS
ncbi:hypothetical protein HWV62_22106 [Athelia sp. TMB]|nr:hypothetical protein HWV62_22106 [Athelia sp. TMB]